MDVSLECAMCHEERGGFAGLIVDITCYMHALHSLDPITNYYMMMSKQWDARYLGLDLRSNQHSVYDADEFMMME